MNTIRMATPSDASAILHIYSPYILNTSITFENEVPSEENFRKRIMTYLKTRPWLVFEMNGIIAGYAYASHYRERTCYQWSTECSVYVHEKYQGNHIGKKLYEILFTILQYQGYRNLYAAINLPNDKSVKFHERFGFRWFANYENVGYKLGQWKTVGWWQLQLNEYLQEPLPVLHLDKINSAVLEKIISDANEKIKL